MDAINFGQCRTLALIPFHERWAHLEFDGNLLSNLVEAISDLWVESLLVVFDSTELVCKDRSKVRRLKYCVSMACISLAEPSRFNTGHVLFWCYMAGFHCVSEAIPGAEFEFVPSLQLLEKEFVRRVKDEHLAHSLSLLSIVMVGLYGLQLSPARLINIDWPQELDPRLALLSVEKHFALLGEAIYTLSAIRGALEEHVVVA